jgi:predicted glycogen debranching enzyme
MTHELSEWLETDGLGGFASGTVGGTRTRRYHGVLLAATTPPTGRMMLVNGVEAWVVTPRARVALSTHLYEPGVRHPDGVSRLVAFTRDPWPTWTWNVGDGVRVVGELFMTHGTPRTVMTWRLERGPENANPEPGTSNPEPGTGTLEPGTGNREPGTWNLEVRPLLSGRDYHGIQRENGVFRFEPAVAGGCCAWRPYDGVPSIACATNAVYHHDPQWFRQFLYLAERERGFDDTEDLASPGVLTFDLGAGEAVCIWQAGPTDGPASASVNHAVERFRQEERHRRARFDTPFARAADQYLVRRGEGRTIVAGYPWFTDWGRDTFIALRGLCFGTGRFADARDILLEWSDAVSDGMLPNRFPDAGGVPEYNSVDASLWFVIAAHELLDAAARRPDLVTRAQRARLHDACLAIVDGYARGTRYGIRMDEDGLLAAGEPGQQLTWMDARVGGREITPRIGKAVEIEALWLNALNAASTVDPRWGHWLARGTLSFSERFWNADRRALYDVVDVDHQRGVCDPTLRPNQVLAVGGLPLPIINNGRARAIVDVIEQELWTPIGLRSLARTERGYIRTYQGDGAARDGAYHQGTAWPWLIGPFVDAWLRVRGYSDEARAQAARRFVAPIEAHLERAGLGHVSEIADGDDPYTPRGCPFQAWSLGELIRMQALAGTKVPAYGSVRT